MNKVLRVEPELHDLCDIDVAYEVGRRDWHNLQNVDVGHNLY